MKIVRPSIAVFLVLVVLGAVHPRQALADTLVVLPDGTGDFPTIQAAIVAAINGDIVELGDGTFTGEGNHDIDFLGKAITVRSVSGNPEACVIDCSWARGFIFQSGEGQSSALEGVTITGGFGGALGGGGVLCQDCSPSLAHVVFLENTSFAPSFGHARGGGMYSEGGSPSLTDVTFIRNTLCGATYETTWGAGMCCVGGAPTLTDVVFLDNQAGSDNAFGGGLYCDDSDAIVTNAVFSGNRAGDYGYPVGDGGGVCVQGSAVFENVIFQENFPNAVTVMQGSPQLNHVTFLRCTKGMNCRGGSPLLTGVTFWKNHDYAIRWSSNDALVIENSIIAKTRIGSAITESGWGSTDVTLTCSDLYDNTGGDWVGCIADQYGINGNIALDALFCDPWDDDFTLHENSPCAPHVPPNSECGLIGACPVGCGPSVTQATSWGSIKAMYR
ncbi:right-handed parallel beta-helix repeat-containing protein [bacterium]|nr:right-handed parallel beta-helix repeat-containing protein [bacterium]